MMERRTARLLLRDYGGFGGRHGHGGFRDGSVEADGTKDGTVPTQQA